jgi:FtsP/CotA-like multicopper oxidase with cupredoxin domain
MGKGFYGVTGVANISSGYSGYFTGGQGLYANGNWVVQNGTKSALVKVGPDLRKLYCEEATEVFFNDYGSGKIVKGHGHVDLDPAFLETVSIGPENQMKVFVTMNGATNGVYVVKGTRGFDVIENMLGNSDAEFDYRVVAKRRGYESVRMEKEEAPR